MTFGSRLKQLLNEKQMSVPQLSEKTGISTVTLNCAIRKDSLGTSMDNILKICEALDITVSYFFGAEAKPRKRRYQKKHYVIDGWEIKKMLREAGMRQQDLSEKMGMSRARLNHVLNGRIPCTQKMANRIADALGVPIERFVIEEVNAE